MEHYGQGTLSPILSSLHIIYSRWPNPPVLFPPENIYLSEVSTSWHASVTQDWLQALPHHGFSHHFIFWGSEHGWQKSGSWDRGKGRRVIGMQRLLIILDMRLMICQSPMAIASHCLFDRWNYVHQCHKCFRQWSTWWSICYLSAIYRVTKNNPWHLRQGDSTFSLFFGSKEHRYHLFSFWDDRLPA